MKNKLVNTIAGKLDTCFHTHPIVVAILLLSIYFTMDSNLLNVNKDIGMFPVRFFLFFTTAVLYLCYVNGYVFGVSKPGIDLPGFVKHPKRYVIGIFGLLTILTIIIAFGYDGIIKCMPNLDAVYYPSQIYLMVWIAPVFEELVFRYYLYDNWARKKYGKILGIIFTGIIFVFCHPITDINSLVLYWIPTLLFYMVYETFGLYGSILVHILYNLIAL